MLPRCPRVSVLWSASANKPIEELSKFMTAAAETSALEARVGHYYQMDGTYLVGREKVREYARAVQDYHPAHWDVAAAAELGYSGPGGAADVHVDPGHDLQSPHVRAGGRRLRHLPADRRGLRAAPPDRRRRRTARRRRTDIGAQDRGQRPDHRDQHLHRHGRRAGAHPAHHRRRRHRRGPRSGRSRPQCRRR